MNADDDARIWHRVRERLDELGTLGVAPRLDEVLARRPPRRDTAAELLGVASTLGLVVALGALLVVQGGPGASTVLPSPAPTPAATPAPTPTPGPVTAVADDWPFRLTFQLPKATYGSSEEITGLASLTVIDGDTHDIWASGGGAIGFSVTEIGGPRHLEADFNADCVRYSVAADAPITTQLRKSGGYDATDTNADWYLNFLTSSAFTLPPGTWEISAVAWFSTPGCGSEPHSVTAPVRVSILP